LHHPRAAAPGRIIGESRARNKRADPLETDGSGRSPGQVVA
jgi:hypothetical protein